MDKEMSKYLEYLKEIYVGYDSFVAVAKYKGDYRLIFPAEVDHLIEDDEECKKFCEWLQKRVTSECVKDGALDYIAFKKMCEEGRAYKQIDVKDELLEIEEIKEFFYELGVLSKNVKKVDFMGIPLFVTLSEEEFENEMNKMNKRLIDINKKYGADLPPIEYKRTVNKG